jgi:hypothetical protein
MIRDEGQICLPNKKGMTPMIVGAILVGVWLETIPENQKVTWAPASARSLCSHVSP